MSSLSTKSSAQVLTPLDIMNIAVNDICKEERRSIVENPNTDFTRDRLLNLPNLCHMLIHMEGNSMSAEILKAFPFKKDRMCLSAVYQQRDKLKPKAFLKILYCFNQYLPVKRRWKGKYRILAIDGSKIQVPTNRKGKYFVGKTGRPRKDGEESKNTSMMFAHGLFDVFNRRFLDMRITPIKGTDEGNDERSAAIDMMLNNELFDSIITMDRGYDGYNMIEHGNRFNGHYVIRCRLGERTIEEVANLPDKEIDKWVTVRVTTSNKAIYKEKGYKHIRVRKKDTGKSLSPNTKYQRWDFEEVCTLNFRIVKFQLDNGTWEVLVTNLNRKDASLQDLKELYHFRWGIETAYRDLKCTLGAKCFHSRKDNFVEQELLAHVVMYNLITALMEEITVEVKKGEKHPKKISFKGTVESLRIYWFSQGEYPYEELMLSIKASVYSYIPGRHDERKKGPPATRMIPFSYRYAA